MRLNLLGITTKLLGLRAWANSGKLLKEQFRTSINLALGQVAIDAPQAFYPSEDHWVLMADSSTTGTSRYARRTADVWVLEFRDENGLVSPLPIPDGAWTPTTDGTWEGVMHLEVKDEKGRWHRRQSREFWYEDNLPGTERSFYVSLDRPFPVGSDDIMEFRIHQPKLYTFDDVLTMDSAMAWDGNNVKAHKMTAGSAERMGLVDYRGTDTGFPTEFFNADHFQLQAPNYTPIITQDAEQQELDFTPWAGPENMGTFRFVYTYVRGHRETEWQEAPGRALKDPMWESGPSPISSAVTHSGQVPGALRIGLPNVDWMQNFDVAGTLRQTRSGWRKRIYVIRDAVQVGAPGLEPNVESAGIPYLLDEVDGSVTEYVWSGTITSDYHRRLPRSTGYYAWKVWPHQDQLYEVDLRITRNPEELEVDQDTPRIKPQAMPAFVELCLYYASLKDGVDGPSAMTHLTNYTNMLDDVRAMLASRGRVIAPSSWAGNINSVRRNYDTYRIE